MTSPTPIYMLLGDADIGYHQNGTIKRGRQIVATVYYCDKLPDDVFATVKQQYPMAERVGIRSEYAPEMKRVGVLIPSKAELKRQAQV